LFFYNRLNFYKPLISTEERNTKPISVIIAAKNEAANLKQNLPKILSQQYASFEVIVVDDYSTDNSLAVLKSIQANHKNLTIVEKENFKNNSGKKLALTAAIEKSRFENLLFTDADCTPSSEFWIQKMANHFIKKDIVLGYGPYSAEPTLLNKFIRYETIITAMNYFSFALAEMPFMGVGRNMGYKKSLFINSSGYSKHLNIASGDDDLFISEVANKTNVSIELSKKAFCYSIGKNNLLAYIKQKQRHVSTSPSYGIKTKSILAFYALSHVLIYFSILISIFLNIFIIAFVILFVSRGIIQVAIFNKTFKKLDGKDITRYIALFDCLFIGYYFLSIPGVFLRNKTQWQ